MLSAFSGAAGGPDHSDETWPLRDRFTIYDAVYLCLANWLGCRLVTADRELARAAGAKVGVFLADVV